jgi:hypothetical protein
MKKICEIAVTRFAFGLLLLFVAGVTLGLAQGERVGGVGITLFDKTDFRGKAVTFREEVYDLASRGFNDKATSVRVGAGEQWEVCEDANFRGRCIVISGEERDLGVNGWNNKISSVRPVGGGPAPAPGGGEIVLFTKPNFGGFAGIYRTANTELRMSARSVKIGQGTWQICDGLRFTGRCITLTQSVMDLGPFNIGRPIRSLRPLGIVPPAPVPPIRDWYIVLFDQMDYRGGSARYNRPQSNISKRAMSATIGQGVWEICDGRNYTGRCTTLTQSVPSLQVFNIGSTIRSVRPVGPRPR